MLLLRRIFHRLPPQIQIRPRCGKPQTGKANKSPDEHLAIITTVYLYIQAVPRNAIRKAVALFQIAEEQQGYFTSSQAAHASYLLGSQAHHVKVGNWVRAARGIYRLVRFPQLSEDNWYSILLGHEIATASLKGSIPIRPH